MSDMNARTGGCGLISWEFAKQNLSDANIIKPRIAIAQPVTFEVKRL